MLGKKNHKKMNVKKSIQTPSGKLSGWNLIPPCNGRVKYVHAERVEIWFGQTEIMCCETAADDYRKQVRHRCLTSQWAFTCSKLTIEILEQGVKYIQGWQ